MRPFNATTEGRQGSISGIPAQEAYCGEGRHLRLASGQTPRSGFATGTGGTPQPAEAARWNARQACPHSGVRYRRFVSLAGRRTGRLLTGAVVITRTHRARALCRQAAGIEDLVGFDIPLAWIIHERTVSVAPTAGNGLSTRVAGGSRGFAASSRKTSSAWIVCCPEEHRRMGRAMTPVPGSRRVAGSPIELRRRADGARNMTSRP